MRKLGVAVAMALFAQSAVAQEVVLVWDPNPEQALLGYHVYRSEASGSGYARLTLEPIPQPQYRDQAVQFATTYYYVVSAVGPGSVQSSFSNEVSIHLGPFFAHFVGGAGLASRLLFQNPSQQTVEGRLQFRDPAGLPLVLVVDGQAVDGALDFSIPAMGSRSFGVVEDGELLQGSVTVQADSELGGVLLLSGLLGETAVAAAVPLASAVLPVEWDVAAGLSTGVAMANPGSEPAEVELGLRDLDGRLVAQSSTSLLIEAGGQIARFPHEVIDLVIENWPTFAGSLEIRSSRPLSLLGLRLAPGGLVGLPVTEVKWTPPEEPPLEGSPRRP